MGKSVILGQGDGADVGKVGCQTIGATIARSRVHQDDALEAWPSEIEK